MQVLFTLRGDIAPEQRQAIDRLTRETAIAFARITRNWVDDEIHDEDFMGAAGSEDDEACDECSGTRWPVSSHEKSCSLYGVNEGRIDG